MTYYASKSVRSSCWMLSEIQRRPCMWLAFSWQGRRIEWTVISVIETRSLKLLPLMVILSAVASKSTSGVVGKWGSFSSIRPTQNVDLKRTSTSTNDVSSGAPKPKKFFKSRDVPSAAAEDDDDEISFKDNVVSKVMLRLSWWCLNWESEQDE